MALWKHRNIEEEVREGKLKDRQVIGEIGKEDELGGKINQSKGVYTRELCSLASDTSPGGSSGQVSPFPFCGPHYHSQ